MCCGYHFCTDADISFSDSHKIDIPIKSETHFQCCQVHISYKYDFYDQYYITFYHFQSSKYGYYSETWHFLACDTSQVFFSN